MSESSYYSLTLQLQARENIAAIEELLSEAMGNRRHLYSWEISKRFVAPADIPRGEANAFVLQVYRVDQQELRVIGKDGSRHTRWTTHMLSIVVTYAGNEILFIHRGRRAWTHSRDRILSLRQEIRSELLTACQ